jgi:hypothetical protein
MNDETKEPFCGACLAVPLAFIGVGASSYGNSSKKKHKTMKKITLWSGVVVTAISLFIAAYYL